MKNHTISIIIELGSLVYFLSIIILRSANIIISLPLTINYVSFFIAISSLHFINLKDQTNKKMKNTLNGMFIVVVIIGILVLVYYQSVSILNSKYSDIFSLLSLMIAISSNLLSKVCIKFVKRFIA